MRPIKAPLVGVIAGVALVAGLALWTFLRVGEAKTVQSDVEARRAAESQRAAALAQEPGKVRVVRGVPDSWQPRIELDGTLQAQHEASLGFNVGGRLARVNVEVGDRVRTGAVLAQLDKAQASVQAEAAEAQVRAAEASLSIAQDAEDRTLPLVENGSVAAATGVQATQQRQLAQAHLDAARAALALARVGAGHHVLSAPFPGTITQAPNGVGAVVAQGQTLFGLVDTTTLKLTTTVSEDDANLLSLGAEVRLSNDGRELTGKLTAILATLDPRTRRVPVVAEFDNARAGAAGRNLRAGAFVRAWVASKDAIPVLRLPHAVLRPGSQDEVLTVNPSSSRLEGRRIVYAIDSNGTLLVRRGISPDDRVVLDPIPEAKANDVVQARFEGAEPEEGAAQVAATERVRAQGQASKAVPAPSKLGTP
jgi:RND family efflux transporter MFP subunit